MMMDYIARQLGTADRTISRYSYPVGLLLSLMFSVSIFSYDSKCSVLLLEGCCRWRSTVHAHY